MTLLPRRALTYRVELVALAVLVAIAILLPGESPFAAWLGMVGSGSVLIFHALAIVILYRSNRFLNFAQLQYSALAATLFAGLVNGRPLLRLFSDAEPGQVATTVNFILAIVITMAVAVLGNALIYQTLIRRFANAPRIMPTLVSIFLAQAFQNLSPTVLGLLQELPTEENLGQGIPNGPAAGPLEGSWTIGGVTLTSTDVLLMVLAPLMALGIGLYLSRSKAGVAIRAVRDNPPRAATLGLDGFGVTAKVWMLAGALAGVAGILQAFSAGAPVSDGPAVTTLPVGLLVLILTVAVFARFESLPMVALSGIVLALVRGAVQRAYGSTVPFEAVLVVLVCVLLLLQRERRTRSRREGDEVAVHEVAREPHPIPPEMRGLPVLRRWLRTGAFVVAAFALGLPWILTPGQVSLAGTFLLMAIAGLSLLILTGWAGQISLGQWGFAAIGAWLTAVTGLPLPAAVLLSMALGAGAAVLVGFPALKLRGLQLAIATLSFAWSVSHVLYEDRYLGRLLPDTLKTNSLLWLDLSNTRTGYYVSMVACALFVLATIGLRRSRFGRALIAVRANEKAAESFGIDPKRLRLTAFAVSGAFAATAGSLYATIHGGAPATAFAADESLRVFMFAVIGGLGGVAGPLLGFSFLGMLTFLSTSPLVVFIGAGLGGLGLLVSAPGGLAEVAYRIRDAGLRRLAIRNRIPAASLLGDRAAHRLQEHALLREHAAGRDPVLPAARYELDGQWALERYGLEGATHERVGAGGGRGSRNGSGRPARDGRPKR